MQTALDQLCCGWCCCWRWCCSLPMEGLLHRSESGIVLQLTKHPQARLHTQASTERPPVNKRDPASLGVRDSPATSQASAGTPAHTGKHRRMQRHEAVRGLNVPFVRWLGLANAVFIQCTWPYIWWFPCQKYRIYTPYIYPFHESRLCHFSALKIAWPNRANT